MKRVLEYELLAGDNIAHVLPKAIKVANRERASVRVNFNGCLIVARPGDSASGLMARFFPETGRKKKRAKHLDIKLKPFVDEQNAKRHLHFLSLDKLDLTDLKAACLWFCEFDNLNCKLTPNQLDYLVDYFDKAGLVQNMCLGSLADDNPYKYIIGQCLNCLIKVDGLPPVIHHFTQKAIEKDV